MPSSLTIIGGGVIGMEFAFIYNALGTKVNVVEFFPQILNNMDADVAEVIRTSAIENGINIYESAKASSIKSALDGTKIVEIIENNKSKYIISEKIAMAVGRKANLESLDLTKLGVELNERCNGIMVDAHMKTSNSNVYTIGDITNKIQLAHIASHQGIVAADSINGIENEMCYDLIPNAIFTMPEVAHVGLNEKDASVDLDKLSRYLTVSPLKLKSKGIDSVLSRVINLKEISSHITIESLKTALITSFKEFYKTEAKITILNENVIDVTKYLEKYNSWEWNYSESPEFSIVLENKFDWGIFEINLEFSDGKIKDCKIFTDSIEPEDFKILEKSLINKQLKSIEILGIIEKHIKNEKIKQELCNFISNKIHMC